MSARAFWLGGALAAALHASAGAQADTALRRPFTFAVLGHIRGENDGKLNPKMGELLDRVRGLRPDFLVLTGDIIWGVVNRIPRDTAEVRRQWQEVDSALATLQVPVFRVPGNHDISDLVTRDLWWQRYGRLPQVIERHGSRLLLLGSAWIPADGDTTPRIVTRPKALDSAQVEWIQAELARSGNWDQTFVAMHHMLWWEPDAPWWRDVHPLLVRAGVRLVFGGDYGPLKFSHLTRDSVLYVQSSMEGMITVKSLQRFERSRVLSAQFDNFLLVRVDGSAVAVEVKTLGEWSSPQYQPAFYQALMRPPRDYGWRSRVAAIATPRRLALVGGFGVVVFGLGILVGRWVAGARRAD